RRAERELFFLELLRLRIGMRRGELDLVGAGTEERAGRLANAGRDPLGLAGAEIDDVDLVEGVARFALALKHEALAVSRPVALSRAFTLDGEPSSPGEEIAFLIRRRCSLGHHEREPTDACEAHRSPSEEKTALIIARWHDAAPVTLLERLKTTTYDTNEQMCSIYVEHSLETEHIS